MRKFFTFILLLGLLSTLYAADIKYPNSWGKAGFTLESSSPSEVNINFSISRFSLIDRLINGSQRKVVQLPGCFLPNDEGMPNLPGLSCFIAIPQGADVEVKIIESRTEIMSGLDIAPAPRIPFDTEDVPPQYNENQQVYSTDDYYPAKPVLISERRQIRGVDVVLLGITPFQYNPVSKELLVLRDIKVQITFSGGNGLFGDARYRSKSWEPVLSDMLLNYRDLPQLSAKLINTSNSKNSDSRDVENVEYLIIVPDDPVFLSWADSLKLFRNQQGTSTGVVTTTEIGGNTFTAIQDYVDNAYYNWDKPPSAVLLLADYGNSGSTITSSPDKSHPYSGTYITDNDFADVDGDHLPDIAFARITARDATELQNTVGKILDYERNPPTNADFYNHPVTAMGWQTSRWFQICSETINGFWELELGKAPVRENDIYSGGPDDGWSTATNTDVILDYFGPSGLGYIPATPDHLTDFGGSATRLNNDINSGAFMVQHRDHGSTSGWSHPSYYISNLSDLHNSDLTFVFSINCETGRFNMSGECFVEAFHRYPNRAIGLIGASQVSYSFVNDTYTWGVYDNMWPQFMPAETTTFPVRKIMPAFANAAGKYFLQQSDWPSNPDNKEITYDLFHHHGGAYSMIYSEMPQNLTVAHDSQLQSNATTFTVTADDGSLIGLTVAGEIIGVGDGTGGAVDIPITLQEPGAIVLVTVTKQNYYRYSSEVDVVSAEGPFVKVDSYNVDDVSTGNGNGQADFNESILLDVTAINIGTETAYGVNAVLSSSDQYLSITDNNHLYGDIAASQTVLGDDAFALGLVNNAPDQYSAACQVTFTDNTSGEWVSNISIKINAPLFEVGALTIDDTYSGNSNGTLDPGETADFIVQTMNIGHAGAPGTVGTLASLTAGVIVNSATHDFTTFAADDTLNAVFSVSADASVSMGTSASLKYTVTSGAYSATDTFDIIVGDVPIYLMANQTVTVNNAIFYDSGGDEGQYSERERFTTTFLPESGVDGLTMHFTFFDVTTGDELHIHDGSTTGAPEIPGSPFSGTTPPPNYTTTNPEGALTFYFTSNLMMNGDGWRAEIDPKIVLDVDSPDQIEITNFNLFPNYPNPFNPGTEIKYQLAQRSEVDLTVYNTVGQVVQRLVKKEQNAGIYTVRFDASALASGVYFCKMSAGNYVQIRKMILLQ